MSYLQHVHATVAKTRVARIFWGHSRFRLTPGTRRSYIREAKAFHGHHDETHTRPDSSRSRGCIASDASNRYAHAPVCAVLWDDRPVGHRRSGHISLPGGGVVPVLHVNAAAVLGDAEARESG